MKPYLHSVLTAALSAAVALSASGTAALAAGYDDHDALQGAKEVKVAFDITAGDAEALLGRLQIIDGKGPALIQQGGNPPFVLFFPRAGAKLVQTELLKIKAGGTEKGGQKPAK